MEHRMIRRVAVCAAIAVLATACNGDDDATSVTTATTSTESSTTDDTSDTTEATASSSTTTASTTTVSAAETTTSAPSTTTEPDDPATTTASSQPDDADSHQSVIDAVLESWRVFNEAKLDPTDDDKVAALGDTTGGDLLQNSIDVIARYRAENKRSVTNPDVPAAIVVYADTLVVDDVAGTAQVDYCRIGSNILVEVGGNADGTDLVLDDTVNTYIERSSLVFEGDHWIETGGVELEFLEGETACPERG